MRMGCERVNSPLRDVARVHSCTAAFPSTWTEYLVDVLLRSDGLGALSSRRFGAAEEKKHM